MLARHAQLRMRTLSTRTVLRSGIRGEARHIVTFPIVWGRVGWGGGRRTAMKEAPRSSLLRRSSRFCCKGRVSPQQATGGIRRRRIMRAALRPPSFEVPLLGLTNSAATLYSSDRRGTQGGHHDLYTLSGLYG